MKVGDKKQVVLLTVVALGAIAFLFTQLGGALKGSRTVPNLLAAMSGQSEPDHLSGFAYPEVVTRDAFAHPKLEAAGVKVPIGGQAKPKHDEPSESHSAKEPGLNPIPADPNWFKTQPQPGAGPEENTGKAEKEKEASATSVKLLATMRASRWIALVQVGSSGSVEVSQGRTVADGIRISSIDEGGIVLSRGKKTSRLAVGEESKL